MTIKKQIRDHLDEAGRLALAEVERMARELLAKHRELDEFVMAMGTVFFTLRNGNDVSLEERAYMKRLNQFICEFDGQLGLTGSPMRFKHNGPTITEW